MNDQRKVTTKGKPTGDPVFKFTVPYFYDTTWDATKVKLTKGQRICWYNARFGKLVVKEQVHHKLKPTGKPDGRFHRVVCDCGAESVLRIDNLRNGHSTGRHNKSCTCKH